MKFAIWKNKFSFAAAVLALLACLTQFYVFRLFADAWGYVGHPYIYQDAFLAHSVLYFCFGGILFILFALALVAIGLRFYSSARIFWIALVLFILMFISNDIFNFFGLTQNQFASDELRSTAFAIIFKPRFSFSSGDDAADSFQSWGHYLALVALILATVGMVLRKRFDPEKPVKSVELAGENRFDPMTGEKLEPVATQPNGGQNFGTARTPDGLRYSSMPLVAFILAFFSPLVAIILAYVSLSQMKYGQVSRVNEGQAKTALILGWVFFGLSMLFGIIWGIIAGVAASRTSY